MFDFITRSVARRVAVYTAAVASVVSAIVGIVVVALVMGDEPAHARRAVLVVALLGGAATVTCVIVATIAVVNRLLTTSLGDLTNALREAEKGRWLRTMKSSRRDEIGELSRAFDRLSSTVTDLSVAVIDSDRELGVARHELKLKEALGLLFELSQSINAEPDLAAVLSAIPRRIGGTLGFEQMALVLLDEASQEFVVRAVYGVADSAIGVRFPRSDVISGAVADSGQPLVIPDTARDPRYSHFGGQHKVDGAFACVPMKAQGRLVGLFNVLRPSPAAITESDVRLLTSLASYAAMAIANAEAGERLRRMAVTDDLTGLANRRALIARAREEVERSRKTDQPLAAIMLDLDHFKKVNDELGHLTGDDVLRRVAAALAAHAGIVARYGGEEFLVLLPEHDSTAARTVAEKLRGVVAALDAPRKITVSAGVATFPRDAADEMKLLDAADQALLVAKRTGRDRVVVA